MTDQGIVLADRVGNAFAYRFNHDHLAAQHIVGLARKANQFFVAAETIRDIADEDDEIARAADALVEKARRVSHSRTSDKPDRSHAR